MILLAKIITHISKAAPGTVQSRSPAFSNPKHERQNGYVELQPARGGQGGMNGVQQRRVSFLKPRDNMGEVLFKTYT